jgi:hypothetical protein
MLHVIINHKSLLAWKWNKWTATLFSCYIESASFLLARFSAVRNKTSRVRHLRILTFIWLLSRTRRQFYCFPSSCLFSFVIYLTRCDSNSDYIAPTYLQAFIFTACTVYRGRRIRIISLHNDVIYFATWTDRTHPWSEWSSHEFSHKLRSET